MRTRWLGVPPPSNVVDRAVLQATRDAPVGGRSERPGINVVDVDKDQVCLFEINWCSVVDSGSRNLCH